MALAQGLRPRTEPRQQEPAALRRPLLGIEAPHEFVNLANQPEMGAAKAKLAKWMPKTWAKSLGGRLG